MTAADRLERYKEIAEVFGVDWRDWTREFLAEGAEHRRARDAEDYEAAQLARRVRARAEARRIPAKVRREVLSAPCAYCGDEATAVDHIVPVSRGGTRRRGNLAPACASCNFDKLDFTPDEWRAWREERGLPWPPLTRLAATTEAVDRALAQTAA